MRNGMRSLWDFAANGWSGHEDEPVSLSDKISEAGSGSPDDVQGNIGRQIEARLQAGHPPGRIAMYLEQVRPGLGRALLGDLQRAARAGPGGGAGEASNPFLDKGVNGPKIRGDDGYASPQFRDVSERHRAIGGGPQFGSPFAPSGARSVAPGAAGKPPLAGSARSGEEDETAPLATDELPGAANPSFDQVQDNIGDQVQARLQAGHSPGRIAMDLERVRPGLGRALLSGIQQAAGSGPGDSANEVVNPFLAKRVSGSEMPLDAGYAPPQVGDGSEGDEAVRGLPQFGPAYSSSGAGAAAVAAARTPPLLKLASINSAAPHRNMAAKPPAIVAKHSGQRHDPTTIGNRVRGLLRQGWRIIDPGTVKKNRYGIQYKQFRDGSIEVEVVPAEPIRKPRPQRMAAAASGQTKARQTPAATLPYDVKEGVTIDDFVAGKLLEIGKAFTKETSKRLTVTDGTRTARQQAKAMYDDFKAGEDGGKYRRKDLVRPIYDAYVAAKKRKASPAATIAEMTAIIEGQVRNGDVISLHLLKRGIDFRTRDLTKDEIRALKRSAEKAGVKLRYEGDHLHGEF